MRYVLYDGGEMPSCNTSAGYSCIGGHCAKEANGQSCTTSANCASGSYCISDWTAKWKGVLRGQLYRRDLWKQGGLHF